MLAALTGAPKITPGVALSPRRWCRSTGSGYANRTGECPQRRVAASHAADLIRGAPGSARRARHKLPLRPRPTFSLAARHNQCRTDSACRTDFGGGKSVGPPWRARRSHFSRVSRELALQGGRRAPLAPAHARPKPLGQPTRVHEQFQQPDESSLRRPGILRSLGRSSTVRLAQRPADHVPSQAGCSPLRRPLLRGEGSPRSSSGTWTPITARPACTRTSRRRRAASIATRRR